MRTIRRSGPGVTLGEPDPNLTPGAGLRLVAELVQRFFALLPEKRRRALVAGRVSIDLGPTDVETYGTKKEGSAWNHAGQRVGRPHPAVWAEAGLVLGADLGSGKSDPRPQAPSLIKRAIAALPDGLARPIVRGDSGVFDKDVAAAALGSGADFAIVAKRNPATWRACREVPEDSWQQAKDMEADVAECTCRPSDWPEGTRCVVRRVPVRPNELSGDARSRRRRTIDPAQLALLDEGELGVAYAYSFIVTNLDWEVVEIESWFRTRALVEEKIKDAKLGAALRHLSSGFQAVNRTWMWSAFLALNISTWLQALCGLDTGPDGRAHGKRLRRELIAVPARVLRHARGLVVRVAPEHRNGVFADAWTTLCAMASRRAGPSGHGSERPPRPGRQHRTSRLVLDLARPAGGHLSVDAPLSPLLARCGALEGPGRGQLEDLGQRGSRASVLASSTCSLQHRPSK